MDKLTYLVKTLSRTNRKDYENFVINAVWNGLGRSDIQPVTQQYVRNHKNGRRFIDLYFPQLNIGIECYEKYHLDQPEIDDERTAELIDILSAINDGEYTPYEVHVYDENGEYSYETAIHEIETAVSALKQKVQYLEEKRELKPWNPELTAEELLQDRDVISVLDNIVFKTITEATNLLFGTDYDYQQCAFFIPRGKFQETHSDQFKVWFPKISVDGSNTRGWKNLLEPDGTKLYERNVNGVKFPKHEAYKRIIIPQVYDPVMRTRGYRFIGVFETDGAVEIKEDGEKYRVWNRKKDSFQIIR